MTRFEPDFKGARRVNQSYNDVYGAHQQMYHPRHSESANDHLIHARQSFMTPELRQSMIDKQPKYHQLNLLATGHVGISNRKQLRSFYPDRSRDFVVDRSRISKEGLSIESLEQKQRTQIPTVDSMAPYAVLGGLAAYSLLLLV